jgi:hypothetical protein
MGLAMGSGTQIGEIHAQGISMGKPVNTGEIAFDHA